MGIFNEHTDKSFAKGIQGAPGVGFNLTCDGDYDITNKKLKNVGAPSDNTDAATKKYVDDNSSGSFDDSSLLKKDGSRKMTGNLNMDNNKIYNLPAPDGPKQPTPLAFTDLKYLHVTGTNSMSNNLNMNNKKINHLAPPIDLNDATNKKYVDDTLLLNNIAMQNYLKKDGSVAMTGNLNLGSKKIVSLATPTTNTDAATKKYVDDNSGTPDLSDYLEKDGTVAMTGNLNVGNNKIINLSNPTQDNEAVTKDYADKLVHHTAVQPSHYNDQFAYLMSSSAQWTDEIDTGTSFFIRRIEDLAPNKGNFHNYNHKVIFLTINKNSQGGFKYKMGINFYRLTANADYTLCLEILNTDYQLWHKSQISVDKGTSKGLSIENVSVKKLSHRYTTSTNKVEFMYYHRIIVNFQKLSTGNKFFLHFLVNIPQEGTDLAVYPRQFSGVYLITYGIVGKISNIDPDKVYDYHTAFDIKPTEVMYNVDINANNKKILNINLDRNSNNSAATVGMVNEIHPFTKNYIYRKYFEDFFDFNDSNIYVLNKTSSGVVFNSLSSITGNSARNITFPTKTIDNIKDGGLNVNSCTISYSSANKLTSYTLCIVFTLWRNRNFSITKKDSNSNQTLLHLYYLNSNNNLYLNISNTRKNITIPSSFNGKKVVLWLTESIRNHVTKVKISNYSAEVVANVVSHSSNQKFEFLNQDGVIEKFMYSPNFYNTDSIEYHTIILQEKLNGSYIL